MFFHIWTNEGQVTARVVLLKRADPCSKMLFQNNFSRKWVVCNDRMHSLMVNYVQLHCRQTHDHVQTFSMKNKDTSCTQWLGLPVPKTNSGDRWTSAMSVLWASQLGETSVGPNLTWSYNVVVSKFRFYATKWPKIISAQISFIDFFYSPDSKKELIR